MTDQAERLGRYELRGELGAGGMGRVVRARDPELGREVALKMLPEGTAGDAERVRRLEREARLLASLNHPNIATLHGLERDGERLFLVMELVEGRPLDRAIAAQPMPVERALEVALQVATGLEAAHDRGVVHRDLKTANVMLRDDGNVKVLDFGLAKPLPEEMPAEGLSEARTAEAPVTRDGSTLGTTAYMSPEQARGEPVDARTDIWAFGCVLYELLTGTRPFERSSMAESLAAVLGEEPDWRLLPASLPARIRLLLHRCLRKDDRQRLRAIGDARIELSETLAGGVDEAGDPGRVGHRRGVLWAATGAAVATLALSLAWLTSSEAPVDAQPRTALRLTLPLAHGTGISRGEVTTKLAISPDGSRLAYVDPAGGLWIQRLEGGEPERVPNVSGAATPTWSPDGRSLAYLGAGWLLRVDPGTGAPPRQICRVAWEGGVSWGAAGRILVVAPGEQGRVVHAVPASGGTPVAVTSLEPGELIHFWPQFLPDGERFLYIAIGRSEDGTPTHELRAGDLGGGVETRIGPLASRFHYHPPTGSLLYVVEGKLVARPFDVERLTFAGEPVPLVDRLSYFFPTGQAEFSSSSEAGGSVVVSHDGLWESQPVWFDRAGSNLGELAPPAAFDHLRIGPGGGEVVLDVVDPKLGSRDLWLHRLGGGGSRRLTLGPADERNAAWSPGGARLAYRSDQQGPPDIWVRPADGSSEGEVLLDLPLPIEPEDWAPDGDLLLYQVHDRTTGEDLWLLPTAGGGEQRPFLVTRYSESGARFSPDGRWIAFVTDESGRSEIYVAPVERPGARLPVSTAGGLSPRWRADGGELFFLGPGRDVMAVAMDGFPDHPPGVPRRLFTIDHPIHRATWDVSPDGERFLVNLLLESAADRPLDVLVDWPALLRR